MRHYWSCTKFADWLRGTAKPYAADSKGWREWKLKASTTHRFRYWLAEEGLDKIQTFIRWPADKLYSIKYWFNNRFITRTHALTSNLRKGEWHEFDTRLLNCMFDELVNFVEVEQAWCNVAWCEDARKKYHAPFYAWGWFRWRTWRSPEAGLDYLKWAQKLTNKEFLSEDEQHLAEPTHQAIAATEILDLYDWWKNRRPARPDPYEASGWSALCENRRLKYNDILWDDSTKEEKKQTKKALDICNRMEEEYDAEDQEMMIRLIKVRRSLWT